MYQHLIFPALSRLDPEAAHNAALLALSSTQRVPLLRHFLSKWCSVRDPRLQVAAFGLRFANPVGLAAGFDKNGRVVDALAALGFGHVEIGTVTPRPQAGRPRPRMFRLPEDWALINRLGFPNLGMERVGRNLARRSRPDCVRGINVGPNAASVAAGRAAEDYAHCIEALAGHADYFTINVSSPNTQGLRVLQEQRALDELLGTVFRAIQPAAAARPVLVKIAPDLGDVELRQMLDVAVGHPVAGIVAANTTLERLPTLAGAARADAGGLSGAPLRERANQLIRTAFEHTEGRLPIIGVGGVFGAADALDKLRAGATLVQLYTGMIYQGPFIARQINRGILAYLQEHGLPSVQRLVGQH